jgi:predicted lipoprotein
MVWKQSSVFRSDPAVESNVFLRAMFSPSKPRSIDDLLEGTRPIDGRYIDELGADAKGFFGLEYALYGPSGLSGTAGPNSMLSALGATPRRWEYAARVADGIVSDAERTARLMGDSNAYAAKFAAGGRSSIEKLIAQTTDTMELIVGRLGRVKRRHDDGSLRPSDVEGYYSATSLDIAEALLGGTEAIYVGGTGGGLSDLVSTAAPQVDARMKAAFGDSKQALAALGAPIERAAASNAAALTRAEAAVKKLEVTMKAEVTSALGVTVTFSGADGD